ncbi:hypothetical protein LTR36_007444 [Oleoguttula mirabilis]|uniref:Cytochrome b561 domain-containing protein n=1 Tax=Oleoguttula mirabilis TaxID=1507867 RepID=A0AAV9J9J4_9PEZI|nr:hypothetical protein LTR36_007444 [Oleoguttula mirabilis]
MRSLILTATALSLASTALASIASTCPESDICYQLNIPSSTTASSGTGDVFFQLSASTAYQWVALGQGSQMAGSNIFVMYTSSSGTNVTVSPRLGIGHVQPQHDTDAHITVLQGSGVSNGRMTANVRCSNCGSWSGGSMDFTGSSSNWIHAYKSGSALYSDDLSESISQHDESGTFTWDLSQAKGGSDANPFTDSVATGTSTVTAASSTSSSSSGNNSNNTTATLVNAGYNGLSQSKQQQILVAHGALAALAFVALFPIGAILIRLANFTGSIWVHAALQLVAYLFYIVAFGLGVYMATSQRQMTNRHPIIGVVLFVILLSQPISGIIHHRLFKKYGHRTLWSYAHLGIGRIAILLGIINGGLGLQLAGESKSSKIAYGVVAAIVGVVYIACMVFGELKRKSKSKTPKEAPGYAQSETELQDRSDTGSKENVQGANQEHYGTANRPPVYEGA